jgi:ABC-2 type transport system ATP-binding protein
VADKGVLFRSSVSPAWRENALFLRMESPIIRGASVLIEGNTPVLSCDHLTKIYEKQRKKALDSVTFSIPSTGIFVLIGRNGSGKTTLVRILATELEPTSGSARIDGIDVVNEPDKLREKIAIVPQEARPAPWMTPVQTASSYLLWRGFGYGEAKRGTLKALKRLGLSDSANTLNRRLSGGMRKESFGGNYSRVGGRDILLG